MGTQVNVIQNDNQLTVNSVYNTITVIDNNREGHIVEVIQPISNIITINTGFAGVAGPVGPAGPTGSSIPFSNKGGDVWFTTSSIEITGSLTVSGSNTFRNIGPAIFSGSVDISSSATINGYLDLKHQSTVPSSSNGRMYYQSGSDGFVLYSQDPSNNEYHTQFKNSSSAFGVYLANAGGSPVQIGSTTNGAFGLFVNGGSPKIRIATNGNVGINSTTDHVIPFNVNGNTNITGSLLVTGGVNATGSINISGSVFQTGSLFNLGGLTVTGDITSSGNIRSTGTRGWLLGEVAGVARIGYFSGTFELSSTANTFANIKFATGTVVDGLRVTGSILVTGSVNASSFTGSLQGTSSYSLSSSFYPSPFPFTGSATISGSLVVSSSISSIDLYTTKIYGGFATGSILDLYSTSGSTATGIIRLNNSSQITNNRSFQWNGNSGVGSSRQWAFNNDVTAYGDFALYRSTTNTGGATTSVLYFDSSGNATLSGSLNIQTTGLRVTGSISSTGNINTSGSLALNTNSTNRIFTSNGLANVTPQIVIEYNSGKALSLLAGVNAAQLAFDSTGNFQIGYDSHANIVGGNFGGGSPVATFYPSSVQITGSFGVTGSIFSTGSLKIYTTGSDLVNIGNATTTNQRLVRIGQDTANIDLGSLFGSTSYGAIYFNSSAEAPAVNNYALAGTNGETFLNVKSGGTVYIRVANSNIAAITSTLFDIKKDTTITGSLKTTGSLEITGSISINPSSSSKIILRDVVGAPSYGALYMGVIPLDNNYILAGDANSTFLNAGTTLYLRIGANNIININSNLVNIAKNTTVTGSLDVTGSLSSTTLSSPGWLYVSKIYPYISTQDFYIETNTNRYIYFRPGGIESVRFSSNGASITGSLITSGSLNITGSSKLAGKVLISNDVVTPSNLLTIGDSDSSTTQLSSAFLNIFNSSATTNNYANIAFGQSGAGSNSFSRFGIQYIDRTGGSEDQDFFWGTVAAGSYSEKMRLTSTGRLTLNGGGLNITGSSIISGSLILTGSTNISGSTVQTGSLKVYVTGSDFINLGNATPNPSSNLGILRIGQHTSVIDMGYIAGSQAAIWVQKTTPSTTNYTITADAATTIFNGVDNLIFSTAGTERFRVNRPQTSGVLSTFNWASVSDTGMTAGTNIPKYIFNGGSTQWLAGNLTNQYFYHFRGGTASFASGNNTITDVYNVYVGSTIMGTGATASANWAAGFEGNVNIIAATPLLQLVSNANGIGCSFRNTAWSMNRNVNTGTIYNSSAHAYQFNHAQSADGVLDSLKLQVYTPAGGAVTSASLGVNGHGEFIFIPGNTISRSSSIEYPSARFSNFTRQWLVGDLAIQRERLFSAPTYSFSNSSTITASYNIYAIAPLMSNNATASRNFAGGFEGNIDVIGDIHLNSSYKLGSGNHFGVPGNSADGTLQLYNPSNGRMIFTSNFGFDFTGSRGKFDTGLDITGSLILSGSASFKGSNGTLSLEGGNLIFPVSSGQIIIPNGQLTVSQFGGVRYTLGINQFIATPGQIASSATTNFTFNTPNNLLQTANTEIPGTVWNNGFRQWTTASMPIQREFWIKPITYTAQSSSFITSSYGFFIEAPIMSASVTSSNIYALGLSGSLNVIGSSSFSGSFGMLVPTASVNFTPYFQINGSGSSLVPLVGVLSAASGQGAELRVGGDQGAHWFRVLGSAASPISLDSGLGGADRDTYIQFTRNSSTRWQIGKASTNNFILKNEASGSTIMSVDYTTGLVSFLSGSTVTGSLNTTTNVSFGTTNTLVYTSNANNTLVNTGATSAQIQTTSGTRTINIQSYAADYNYIDSTAAPLYIRTTSNTSLFFGTNAITRLTITNNGDVNITGSLTVSSSLGVTGSLTVSGSASFNGYFQFTTGSNIITLRDTVGIPTYAALYMNQAVPSSTNYTITTDGSNPGFNGATSLALLTANVTRIVVRSNNITFTPGVASGASIIAFAFTASNNTNQTSGVPVPKFQISLAGTQWISGSISSSQGFVEITQPTMSFTNQSTASIAATLRLVGGVSASTSASITENAALLIDSGSVGSSTERGYGALIYAPVSASVANLALGLRGKLEVSGSISVNDPTGNTRLDLNKTNARSFFLNDGSTFSWGTSTNHGMEIYTNNTIINRVGSNGIWSYLYGANVTGSLNVTGSSTVTGSLSVTGSASLNGNKIATKPDVVFSINLGHGSYSPGDATIIYYGMLTTANPSTSTTWGRIYIPIDCTLTGFDMTTLVNGSAGTNESSSFNVRINDTTDVFLTSASFEAVSGRGEFHSTNLLSQSLNAGDFINIKWIPPTWVTNPTSILNSTVLWFKGR